MRAYKQGRILYYAFDTQEECTNIRDLLIDEGIYTIIAPDWKAWTIKIEGNAC